MADNKKKCSGKDTVRFGPQVSDNAHLYIRHKADHTIQAGIAHVCDGEKANDEVTDYDGIFRVSGEGPDYDVESLWERGEDTSQTASGPAQVSTPAFRSGWDRIFGNTVVGQA